MHRIRSRSALACAALCAGVLVCGVAYAEKPDHAGGGGWQQEKGHGGKGGGQHKRDRDERGDAGRDDHDRGARARDDGSGRVVTRFEQRERTVIREYFVREGGSGKCPPGLAKKGNGCMPPGQARKWSMGRPLPRDVVYYDLPPALVVELGVPPAGHKFVRVAGDILMIAVGTSMVVDAIQDLGGM
ncbi:hypothetical protein GPA22_22210 [Aromatoleum toluvorans]|uniref:Nickel/cobalt transporter regulator n=1 Tax=Aromatoleum toluvorans TaxID=92002 RepID=A0ABX1Q7H6_9RHOO|nr:hypothetical protein [Aromatoleum toluvorans]NMG46430.1 hypothetical protein [Aromatoleum toluvorans]